MKTGRILRYPLAIRDLVQSLHNRYRSFRWTRRGAFGLVLLLLVLLILTGCQNYATGWQPYQPLVESEVAAPDTDGPSEDAPSRDFAVWGETDAYALEAFIKRHPELDVTYEKQNPSTWQSLWTAALAAGTGPDVFVYAAEYAGWSATLDIFEDLSSEAYSLNTLRPLLSEAEWVETLSFDRSKRVHLPIYTYPAMLFYRADILEQNGYPSEPEDLAAYLENPTQWLDMVREMKRRDLIVMEWKESPWNVGGMVRAPFSQNLEWHMADPSFPEVLQATATASHENLPGYINIWDEVGRSAIRSDKLIMFVIGAWGVDLLPGWIPEQAGKWRATRLPMGLSVEWGTRWMSMNLTSKNKEIAWDLMESTITSVRKNYTTLRNMKYPYFGGQQVLDLSDQMRMEMEPVLRTPIDTQVSDLFWSQQYLMYEGKMLAQDFINHFNDEIETTFEFELSMLREARNGTGQTSFPAE